MLVLEWQPRKPKRITARMFRSGDRLIREFVRSTGRWPKSGVICLDNELKSIEHIEFEPSEPPR